MYQHYDLVVRLIATGKKTVISTDARPEQWMPGKSVVNSVVEIPSGITPGKYKVEIALVTPGTANAVISIANKGKTSDGWYSTGEIEIK